MKCIFALALVLITFQINAEEYTVDWAYYSKSINRWPLFGAKTSYHVKTVVDKKDNSQTIVHHFPTGFSFSLMLNGYINEQLDSLYVRQLYAIVLTSSHQNQHGLISYRYGTASYQSINLLIHMAAVLDGQASEISSSALISFPLLPAPIFPDKVDDKRTINKIRIIGLGNPIVHAQVTVFITCAKRIYNVYLTYQDGHFHCIVSEQEFSNDQILQVISLHESASEHGVVVSLESHDLIGLGKMAYQYASIPEAAFEAITGVTHHSDTSSQELEPLGGSEPEVEKRCFLAVVDILVRAIAVMLSYVTCGVSQR